jgi:hypothetical protein
VTPEWLVAAGAPGDRLGAGERPPLAAPDGCSFCGMPRQELEHLFGNQDATRRICDRCVRMASEMIADEDRDSRSSS